MNLFTNLYNTILSLYKYMDKMQTSPSMKFILVIISFN